MSTVYWLCQPMAKISTLRLLQKANGKWLKPRALSKVSRARASTNYRCLWLLWGRCEILHKHCRLVITANSKSPPDMKRNESTKYPSKCIHNFERVRAWAACSDSSSSDRAGCGWSVLAFHMPIERREKKNSPANETNLLSHRLPEKKVEAVRDSKMRKAYNLDGSGFTWCAACHYQAAVKHKHTHTHTSEEESTDINEIYCFHP